MPPKKDYTCLVCTKRVKQKERRPLTGPNNKALRKYSNKCPTDAICNKFRQKFYSSSKTRKGPTQLPPSENAPCLKSIMSPPSVPLSIPSSGYSHGSCPICNTRKNKLTTVPQKAVLQLFAETGVLLDSKARCCPNHLKDGLFSGEISVLGKKSVKTVMSKTNISKLIENLRQIISRQGKV